MVVEQTYRFIADPLQLVEDSMKECGDVFTLHLLGLGRWVFLCAPDLVEQMVRSPPDAFAAGEVNRKAFASLSGASSSFGLDGEEHRARRRLIQPYFSEGPAAGYADVIREIAERAIASWPVGREFPLMRELHEVSYQVILRVIFGIDPGPHTQKLESLIRQLAEKGLTSPLLMAPPLQVDFGPRSPWGEVVRIHADAMAALTEEIARRSMARDYHGRDDIFSKLLQAREANPDALPVPAIRDELVQLLFAGHETAGLVMSWAVERILAHPAVLARVREETAAATRGAPVGAAHLPLLPYLDAAISEGTRTRSPSPISGLRVVKTPFEVRDYVVPEGDYVAIGFQGLCMRDDLFPEPHRYHPERFLERKYTPFEWAPFGAGSRLCLGRSLAQVEMKVVLATLLSQTRLRLARPEVRGVRRGMFIAPADGLPVVFEGRA